ncbi:hypothetical protein M407DRAFT_30415 [Tulasnella calospora MUT 4182]|uniref:Uncharacterized protein n=1 Tax=Tulasnella calospora MUT 4182 TaxID=1051891 RepID=A0A0C3Q8A3_9AGAM|nr:hypothetical protein M407DRAFT_30415 [Tulasnella calospora MUT 4182]
METIRTAIASLGLQGALAILADDTTNTAAKIINYTIPNAVANCAQVLVLRTACWTRTLLSPSPDLVV